MKNQKKKGEMKKRGKASEDHSMVQVTHLLFSVKTLPASNKSQQPLTAINNSAIIASHHTGHGSS